MTDFNLSVRENGAVKIIELQGNLDAHTAPNLENTFAKLISEENYKIVVNFQKLAYISSAGLGVFMAFVETVRENQGDIKFSNMIESVYDTFDLLGFPMLYKFFDEESQAIKDFDSENDEGIESWKRVKTKLQENL